MIAGEAFVSDSVLKDGSIIRIRPVREHDRQKLDEFLDSLSEETVYLRFNTIVSNRDVFINYLMNNEKSFNLVAEREEKIVAHAGYVKVDNDKAEPAIVVSEKYRGLGLGTLLLLQLMQAASIEKITTFEAYILPENYGMINLVKKLNTHYETSVSPGKIVITFPTSLTEESIEEFEKREKVSAVSAVRSFLYPRSIAVIGASRDRGTISGNLFKNIIQSGFNGPVYPVNKNAEFVQSVKAYRSIMDVDSEVELAIICVPVGNVIEVANECAKKKVRSLVVISSGFAEAGREGAELQEKLVEICRTYGMRLIGPNCMGIVNTDASVSLNAQFSRFVPIEGKVGFLSQSGALGVAVIQRANELSIGMSSFVSVGNKADISGNDLLQFWEDDERTRVILLYLESFGNPRKFTRIARRVSRKKPIIVVKGGRSRAGFRAAQSHTGALVSSSNTIVDALFKQCGVIRTDTLEEMFDVASFLLTQPVPASNKVGIITNAGGAGILAADACESYGLEVPELSDDTQRRLREFLPSAAALRNPVDMIASASKEDYVRAVRVISQDPNIDSLIVIFIPPLGITPAEITSSLLNVYRSLDKKIAMLACIMADRGLPSILSDAKVSIPSYPFPEEAARTLAKVAEYGRWLSREEEYKRFEDTRKEEAISIVSRALKNGGRWLRQKEIISILEAYGIPIITTYVVSNESEAELAAESIEGSLVIKGSGTNIVHKKSLGLVSVDIKKDEVASEVLRIKKRLEELNARDKEIIIQPFVKDAFEMIIGSTYDNTFGSVLLCGAGGSLVEIMRDFSVGISPITEYDAYQMISSLKVFPLINGEKGKKYDVNEFKDILIRVSNMVEDIPQLVEIDLNPVMLFEDGMGARVVDARMRIEEIAPTLPIGAKKK